MRAIATLGLGMVLLLASVGVVWVMTGQVMRIEQGVPRALAVAAEAAVGVALLLASLWVSTHLTVRALGAPPQREWPQGPPRG